MENVYNERILQELGWGNYSDVKKITSSILMKEPTNKNIVCLRDYIEYHKKSNGRYEVLQLKQYLQYIINSIEKFYESEDLTLFLKCLEKDYYNIDINQGVCNIEESDIGILINRFEHIQNCIVNRYNNIQSEVLSSFIEKLYKIKEEYEKYTQEKILRQKGFDLIKQENEERELKEKRKKIIIFLVALVVCFVGLLIKCNG